CTAGTIPSTRRPAPAAPSREPLRRRSPQRGPPRLRPSPSLLVRPPWTVRAVPCFRVKRGCRRAEEGAPPGLTALRPVSPRTATNGDPLIVTKITCTICPKCLTVEYQFV